MIDLDFAVEGADVVPFAASPQLAFRLRIKSTETLPVHTVALRCQVQIESARRHYSPEERALLLDLFGEPERWSQTLRTMLWTHIGVIVPRFTGETVVDLPVPCTFDFNVAATKYFHGLTDGEIPLLFLFSGTVFYEDDSGVLQVAPISWEREASFRLPASVWHGLMEAYYPNTAWMCLRRDVFDRLYQFKANHGIPTWERVVERLLETDPNDLATSAGEAVPS